MIRLLGWGFIFEMAHPGTVWWHLKRAEGGKNPTPNQRVDSLVALERVFVRKHRLYVYQLKVGRLRVIFARTNQGR